MNAYFVTGTDTGVGKTTVSCALLAAAAQSGLRAIGMKPAESGCQRSPQGDLIPDDARRLLAASNIELTLDEICLYRFAAPLAPAVAAQRTHTPIEVDQIGRMFNEIRQHQPDLTLVEGAGGLLVPFAENVLAADIASLLDLPLLVVARPGLGTINHTLLTLESARNRGLTMAGFIFSCSEPGIDLEFAASNAAEIRKVSNVPFLGLLPFISSLSLDTLAQAGAPLLPSLTH